MTFSKREKQLGGIMIILLAIIGFGMFYQGGESDINDAELFTEAEKNGDTEMKIGEEKPVKDEAAVVQEPSLIVVDVKGAVQKPGVYTIPAGKRVTDVVNLAGGFIGEADQSKVNLAAVLTDAMVVYIPKVGENTTEEITGTFGQQTLNEDSGKININTADINQLQELTGIGPSKAEAIKTYRDENGPFQQAEDLMDVPGIGEKSFEKMRDQVVVQ